MSRTTLKTTLYPQGTNTQHRGRAQVITSSSLLQDEAHTLHISRQGHTDGYTYVTPQVLDTQGLSDEDEHIKLSTELGSLLGSYQRMN